MQISPKALRVLQAERISPEELMHMLNDAAFTSVRGCNLRYFQWLFVKRGDVLQDMQRFELVEIGKGPNRMLEDHDDCDGEGCAECGWAGQVSRAIVDSTATAMNATT
jgi:hypothetical protein